MKLLILLKISTKINNELYVIAHMRKAANHNSNAWVHEGKTDIASTAYKSRWLTAQ